MGEEDINGQLKVLSNKVDGVAKTVDKIEAILVGNTENPEKKGLLERVRKTEAWILEREWFEKLLIVAVVGNFIGLVFVLIQNLISN